MELITRRTERTQIVERGAAGGWRDGEGREFDVEKVVETYTVSVSTGEPTRRESRVQLSGRDAAGRTRVDWVDPAACWPALPEKLSRLLMGEVLGGVPGL
jgi:hypothetical protein